MQRQVMTLWLVIYLISTTAWAYSGGNGSAEDPFQIATAQDLIDLGNEPNDYDKHFVLTADIDLDPNLPGRMIFDRAVIAPDINDVSSSYSYQGTAFTGTLDGQGHVIRNLRIRGQDFLGLIGSLEENAALTNLGLEVVDINGTDNSVGGLVGLNAGTITSSYSSGTINGNDRIGGLVGDNDGSITSSHSTVAVRGNRSPTGPVEQSPDPGTAVGRVGYIIGGLVGFNKGTITSVHSTGTVSGIGAVGGVAGINFFGSMVTLSSNTGTISGDGSVGGLVGYNYGGSISDCYSTGSVTGSDDAGGLVGVHSSGSISSSYSIGSVRGDRIVGGLVGYNDDSIVTSSFWDIETSGQGSSAGGIGLMTAKMQDINTFLNAGWDFVDETINGSEDIWRIPENDYPLFWWQEPHRSAYSGGNGTLEDPFQIATAQDLIDLGNEPNHYDKNFILTADIDLSGYTFDRAVVAPLGYVGVAQGVPFTGSFDGQNYVVRNLTIYGGDYLGLFGQLTDGCCVSNLGLTAVEISGIGVVVGGLAGSNSGSIISCYIKGTVSGSEYIGGVVGANSGSIAGCYNSGNVEGTKYVGGLVGSTGTGFISSSYSTASVSGGDYVGGLVGHSLRGQVTSSYSMGTVSGDNQIGGLVGGNAGNITSCYSTCTVSGNDSIGGLVGVGLAGIAAGDITSSFWDIQTSGQTFSNGGTGLTTAFMQNINTFLDAGWDFVNETANGTEDLWWMPDNDYPMLWWQEP